jgi:carbon storage regulator
MLVVTRKIQEALRINDEVRVEVVDIRAGRVKLGVEAPAWMSIQREEIAEASTPSENSSAPPGADRRT